MLILCLNRGSSSLKFAVFRCDQGDEVELACGAVEGISQEHGRLWIRQPRDNQRQETQRFFSSHQAAFEATMELLVTLKLSVSDKIKRTWRKLSDFDRQVQKTLSTMVRISTQELKRKMS